MNPRSLYLRLLAHVRPYRRTFVLAIAATVVLALTEPAMPMLLKPLLDGSFVEKDPQMIVLMPIALVLLFAVRGLATIGSQVAMEWVANKVVTDLRNQMFDKLLSLPSSFYDANATGVVISKVTYDVEQVTTAATKVLVIAVRDSLAITGLLAWIFYLNWRLALIAFAITPVVAFLVRLVSRRLRRVSHGVQGQMGEMTHILEEAINGNRVVRVFGGQEYERGRFRRVTDKVRQLKVKMVVASNSNVQVIQVMAVATLAFMAYLAAQQKLTVGEFVSFFTAVALILSPLKRLTNINEPLQKGLAAAESIFRLLDEPSEQDPGRSVPEGGGGEVRFEGVTLRYPDTEEPALADIDLEIRAGEHIALVGPSGSGKSTLANLLPLFYRPDGGRITLDGVDLAGIPLRELRRRVALVSQEVVLFNDTVRANIAYGEMSGMPDQAVEQAAAAANALEFIRQLPQGMQTPVGANGVRLSGGQRQRLAIARALLKDAPILVMDEATSALDTESEKAIQQALETLKAGRTTITIAHRLSTIEKADRIVVLDRGRIVETGSHEELLAANGLYARLYQARLRESAG
ncbi:MAG TPA: lipid A export permease/ATP-binding protein MsbA [Sedimenticola thiotaurini]|uniref:Lipid A export permease/ATP-binding protein MsbA n=1 Tax=Sedimenticola thiotaurini TaxID=1543721 RepID=A0A831RNB7_9GAMM|nr:lipid A export permease/ATP-binding protein MsbA [Sedimenticola thiotaurini]